MRLASLRWLLALMIAVTLVPSAASAQDGTANARAVAQCLHEHDEQMQRLVRLLDQAEQRAQQADIAEDVRRDAVASIGALVDRIRALAQQVRHCIEQHPIAVRVDGTVTERPADRATESLATDRGTVHEIERGTSIASEISVVRGERVDGAGSAPDSAVQSAVRGIGARIAQCYESARSRGARASGELHLTFTASDGGRVSQARVERSGGLDTAMRQCVERAAVEATIAGQRGRSVYAYVLRFGAE